MTARRGEHGFVTLQHVLATGLSLVLFTLLANVIVVQFGRGVARAAADDGARAGARVLADDVRAAAACRDAASATRDGLLAGRLAEQVTVACRVGPSAVEAAVRLEVDAWLPLVPGFASEETAVVVRERLP